MNNIGSLVADISDTIEKENTAVKLEYFKKNINTFIETVNKLSTCNGIFGTGYPFYATDELLKRKLFIIKEQLRYNNELRNVAQTQTDSEWKCEKCLLEYGDKMPDLKSICKPCPNINAELKPRKVINRLPDLDIWTILEDNTTKQSCEYLTEHLYKAGFKTSDVDPVDAINRCKNIAFKLKSGLIPDVLLPLDTHVIEKSELINCLLNLKEEIVKYSDDYIPYISIHPLSLRKTWHKDDTGYNFIHDFLYGFTPFNLNKEIEEVLIDVRKFVVNEFDVDTLFDIARATGAPVVQKRNDNQEIKELFKEKMETWKRL